jgi:hypothetical protein
MRAVASGAVQVKLWAGLWVDVFQAFPAKPLREMVGTRRLESPDLYRVKLEVNNLKPFA